MFDIITILEAIEGNFLYLILLTFFAWYPIVSSAVLVFAGLVFFFRRERTLEKTRPPLDEDYRPTVSVVISAFNEEEHIAETIKGCLKIDYPNYEIIVVDDGSTDETVNEIMPFVRANLIRLVEKQKNEGKAMALNDALQCARGEIFLIMDADAIPEPNILDVITPHFKDPRVGAVTGNPRVYNRRTMLSKLQAIEFTSIISLQRRAQRIWGRILTMSGVVGAFHRNAIYDVGLFSPQMSTEDIDLSWKLQLRHYDIRYEPRAIVWMRVPETFMGLLRQRHRWATGLGQVLRRYVPYTFDRKARRLWPLVTESLLSILWAYCFVFLTALWIFCYAIGYPPVGASPIPNWWGMLIGTMCLLQLLTGSFLDRRYDKKILVYFFIAVFYPLIYWIFMAVITAVSTPKAVLESHERRGPIRWKPVRNAS